MRVNAPTYSGIEVTGRVILAALEAFGGFTVLAGEMLMANGIGKPGRDGFIQADTESWYPLEGYLKIYKQIEAQFGEMVVRKLGAAKAKHVRFPPHPKDVSGAMQAMDVGYHMNHRHQGRIMFDPVKGTMLEGIGHYHCQQIPGQRKIAMRCDNPYPCAFDAGIIEAMAQRYVPTATVSHDPSSPCRKKGATSCTYLVTW
jgi:hypothetical protein